MQNYRDNVVERTDMPSIREMRQVCQQRVLNKKGKSVWAGHWFNRLVTRWFSIYFTWLFVKLGISANTVTFMMILSGLAGFALSLPHLLWVNIAGAVLLLMGEVLDCVDGEVARWTKKSSLKGFYLDLVNHVLCNAPASSICALHLYSIHRQDKYLILGFAAYAMAQIRLGLKEEYYRVAGQMTSSQEPVQASAPVSRALPAASLKRRLVGWVKWLMHMFVDEYLIRIFTIAAVLLTYAGIEAPILVLAWWFVIFGFVTNVFDIINKYVVLIPDSGHIKKV